MSSAILPKSIWGTATGIPSAFVTPDQMLRIRFAAPPTTSTAVANAFESPEAIRPELDTMDPRMSAQPDMRNGANLLYATMTSYRALSGSLIAQYRSSNAIWRSPMTRVIRPSAKRAPLRSRALVVAAAMPVAAVRPAAPTPTKGPIMRWRNPGSVLTETRSAMPAPAARRSTDETPAITVAIDPKNVRNRTAPSPNGVFRNSRRLIISSPRN